MDSVAKIPINGRRYLAHFGAKGDGVVRITLRVVTATDAAAVQKAILYAVNMNPNDLPKLLHVFEADEDWNEVREIVTCFG